MEKLDGDLKTLNNQQKEKEKQVGILGNSYMLSYDVIRVTSQCKLILHMGYTELS